MVIVRSLELKQFLGICSVKLVFGYQKSVWICNEEIFCINSSIIYNFQDKSSSFTVRWCVQTVWNILLGQTKFLIFVSALVVMAIYYMYVHIEK